MYGLQLLKLDNDKRVKEQRVLGFFFLPILNTSNHWDETYKERNETKKNEDKGKRRVKTEERRK